MSSKKYGRASPKTSRSGSISLPIPSMVISALPTSMKSVGISRPYLMAPCDEVADHRRELDLLQRACRGTSRRASRPRRGTRACRPSWSAGRWRRARRRRRTMSLRTAATIRSTVRSRSSGDRRPTMPRSIMPTTGSSSGAHDDDVAGVRIGVEEAVLEDHLDDDPGGELGDRLAARPRRRRPGRASCRRRTRA